MQRNKGTDTHRPGQPQDNSGVKRAGSASGLLGHCSQLWIFPILNCEDGKIFQHVCVCVCVSGVEFSTEPKSSLAQHVSSKLSPDHGYPDSLGFGCESVRCDNAGMNFVPGCVFLERARVTFSFYIYFYDNSE